MAIQIPLSALPNQELLIVLGEQRCTLHVFDRGGRLYLDLYCDYNPVQLGAICLPFCPIITATGRGFIGQLRIIDKLTKPQAQAIPYYQGLGSRFFMYYLSAQEEAQIGK